MNPFLAFATVKAVSKRARQRTGLKQPVKTIRNNHQLRFT